MRRNVLSVSEHTVRPLRTFCFLFPAHFPTSNFPSPSGLQCCSAAVLAGASSATSWKDGIPLVTAVFPALVQYLARNLRLLSE